MKQVKRDGTVYYAFTHFPQDVRNAFFTRSGGISSSPYDELNLGLHVGDRKDSVLLNRRLACAALGAELSELVAAKQIHSTNIRVVGEALKGCGSCDYETAVADTDGLVTASRRVLLTIYCADCVPVYLVDPRQKVIALVHSGWRGTAGRIAKVAVEKMQDEFGTSPEDVLAGIGPSIGPCCYEVDEAVAASFREGWPTDILHPARPGDYYLDLWTANRIVLESCGVLTMNIRVASLCTHCQSDQFFSYRKSRVTGRNAAFLMMV